MKLLNMKRLLLLVFLGLLPPSLALATTNYINTWGVSIYWR